MSIENCFGHLLCVDSPFLIICAQLAVVMLALLVCVKKKAPSKNENVVKGTANPVPADEVNKKKSKPSPIGGKQAALKPVKKKMGTENNKKKAANFQAQLVSKVMVPADANTDKNLAKPAPSSAVNQVEKKENVVVGSKEDFLAAVPEGSVRNQDDMPDVKPRNITLDAKQRNIAAGARRGKTDYPTMEDVKSDWNSLENEEKKKTKDKSYSSPDNSTGKGAKSSKKVKIDSNEPSGSISRKGKKADDQKNSDEKKISPESADED